jgi:hypothetical protein
MKCFNFFGTSFSKVVSALALLLLASLPAPAQTQCSDTNIVKYYQPPNLAGFDVLNSGPWVLADDFICTNTGPISDIYIWGSWLGNNTGTITNFWLGIYDDVPANANNPPPENTNSHPGNLLWQETFAQGQFVQSFFSDSQEQFLDPSTSGITGTDSQAWEYCFYPTIPFTQTGSTSAPKTYWIAAYAQVASVVGAGTPQYGWKTTSIVQNDISVYEAWPGSLPGTNSNWLPTAYQSATGGREPLDLAFKLETTTNNCIDFSCPSNVVVYMPCGSSCAPVTYPPVSATNNCDPAAGVTVSFNPPSTSCFPLGTTPVVMTVSGSGQTNSCTFTVTVLTNPNCPPTNNPPCLDFVCPGNLTLYMPCGSSCAPVTYPPSFATNYCSPTAGVTVSYNPPSGSCFPLGTTPVTMTVSGSGETSNCTFSVTVLTNPNCPPTNNPPCLDFVCPGNLTLYMPCGSSCAPVTYPPSFATNYCSPSAGVTVSYNPPSGSCFPLGTTPVTMTVSGSGETSNCTFSVTVLNNPNCPPTNNPPCLDFVCPSNLMLYMPCGASCVPVTYPPSFATNYCIGPAGGVTVTYNPPAGSCFPLGTTPVTMTVSGGGETSNCTFSVTVLVNPNCPSNVPPVVCVDSNDAVKYVQAPNLSGYDVFSEPNVLADDFVCTATGPISDIHIWGSWRNNLVDTNAITFWLGIYDDVPVSANNPFSHPGTNLLWQQWFAPGQYAESFWGSGQESFLDPVSLDTSPETNAWYYCFYPTNPFVQLGTAAAPKTFWLAVDAELPVGIGYQFGWKTTPTVQNDVSVHAPWPGYAPTNNPGWTPTMLPTGAPLDLAFSLTTQTNCCPVSIIYNPTNKIVVISWDCGVLQSATNVIGPYFDMSGATSPYTTTVFLAPPHRFYRTRCD